MTGLLPVALFMHGLTCLAIAATIFMNWLLGAFPRTPTVDASLAIAAAIATAGVTTLLISSFLVMAADSRRRGRASGV